MKILAYALAIVLVSSIVGLIVNYSAWLWISALSSAVLIVILADVNDRPQTRTLTDAERKALIARIENEVRSNIRLF